MEGLMKYINRTSRAANCYRGTRLCREDLSGFQHVYIFQICRHPGISQERLARHICVDKSNVARQLATLQQAGYVRREPDPGDKRALRVFPTPKAEAVFPQVCELMRELDDALLQGFSSGERETLIALLARVAERAATLTGASARGGNGNE